MTGTRRRGGARPRRRPRGTCPVCGSQVAGVSRGSRAVELSPHGPPYARCSGTGSRTARVAAP